MVLVISTITIKWVARGEGNSVYVAEYSSTEPRKHWEYGPMSEDVLEQFIAERKAYFASVYKTLLRGASVSIPVLGREVEE